jgi:hypothetical protein
MKVIEATARVSPSGVITIQEKVNVPPGTHRVIVVVEETPQPEPTRPMNMEDWLVHDVGPWPEGLSLRREDMYGDWGR